MTKKIRDKMFVMGVPHRVIIVDGLGREEHAVITPVSMVYSSNHWCVLTNVNGKGMRTIPLATIYPNWD